MIAILYLDVSKAVFYGVKYILYTVILSCMYCRYVICRIRSIPSVTYFSNTSKSSDQGWSVEITSVIHHHWLDSPTWALAFLRSFYQ
jgi:hypothetical protein